MHEQKKIETKIFMSYEEKVAENFSTRARVCTKMDGRRRMIFERITKFKTNRLSVI